MQNFQSQICSHSVMYDPTCQKYIQLHMFYDVVAIVI